MNDTECVHRFNIDRFNKGTCSLCHEERQYPDGKGEVIVLKKGNPSINPVLRKEEHIKEKNTRGNIQSKRKYNDAHRAEIEADIRLLGVAATSTKWHMPKSTLHGLVKRWSIPKQPQPPQPSTPPIIPQIPSQLPKLPDFSPEWPMMTQIKWLEVYQALATPAAKPSPNGARDALELTRTG